MNYLVYIFWGLLPSLIWLAFYLRKDAHPEPKNMVIKIFIFGILSAPLAALMQFGIGWLIHPMPITDLFAALNQRGIFGLMNLIMIAPITEELCKYLAVKSGVMRNQNLDEPVDLMIYFVIAGLGFAAIENFLVFSNLNGSSLSAIIGNVSLRFLSATFIHALAAATFGYFMALSFYNTAKRKQYLWSGGALAIFFHASYNYLVYLTWNTVLNQTLAVGALIIFFTFLSAMVSWQFQDLKNKKAICK